MIDAITSCYDHDGMDETIVICRSNKRANLYNNGIRAQILWREDELNTALFFMLIPPVSSTTKNLSNYMKIDGDTEQFESCVNSFFPNQIPVSAKQADYFYQRYSSFFEEEVNMEASWILTPLEYDTIKQQALELRQFKNSHLSESGGNGTILGTLQPENVTIVFEYNDNIKKVTYRAYTTKNY